MSEPRMILRSTLTSPFGRKVRMAADTLGLSGQIEIVSASTMDVADTLRTQNPLGKIPALITAEGTVLYDSGVIIEYLQELSGTDQLVPKSGIARYRALTRARLADGITEAALLIMYESRFREAHQHAHAWVEHQRGKIMRALAAFTHELPEQGRMELVGIGLSCALGYLDWRKPCEWRDEFMLVASWLEQFENLHPVFIKTAPPEGS